MPKGHEKHVAKYGELAVELDAFHPATLQDAVKGAIEQNLDMAQFSVEQEREPEDIERIETLRSRVMSLLDGEGAT